ncbi:YHS domain-containing protein [Pseudomonas aeruginosa]|nr:YHS domain-containing protein [Pseudomonas aeruginosa]
MAVTAASEHRSSTWEHVLFCSTGCKAKFDADPARYATVTRA